MFEKQCSPGNSLLPKVRPHLRYKSFLSSTISRLAEYYVGPNCAAKRALTHQDMDMGPLRVSCVWHWDNGSGSFGCCELHNGASNIWLVMMLDQIGIWGVSQGLCHVPGWGWGVSTMFSWVGHVKNNIQMNVRIRFPSRRLH